MGGGGVLKWQAHGLLAERLVVLNHLLLCIQSDCVSSLLVSLSNPSFNRPAGVRGADGRAGGEALFAPL